MGYGLFLWFDIILVRYYRMFVFLMKYHCNVLWSVVPVQYQSFVLIWYVILVWHYNGALLLICQTLVGITAVQGFYNNFK